LFGPWRAARQAITNGDADRAFPLILAISLVLSGYHLQWGLPNGNFSWAADALGPLSVLSIARRSLSKLNSGWFWYKYPFGYPMLLLAAYAPYLGWLVVTGQLRNPTTVYPYGFADAETAMFVLAMLGRVVNVILVVATVAVTYGIGHRLGGRNVARLAAWLVGTSYPMIFYAHTTNQDAAYVFWLALAMWAVIVAGEEMSRRWPFVVLGVAAAMAMATKEQGFGLLLVLPLLLAWQMYRAVPSEVSGARRWVAALWNGGSLALVVATLVTTLIANNALINPQGVINRILDLTGHPVPGISSRLTPIKFSLFKGIDKELWYLRQLVDVTESSFGLPIFALAVVGLIYLVVAQRRAALLLLVPALAYYVVSLRTHDLLALRYALPLLPILAVAAAFVVLAAQRRMPHVGNVAIALVAVLSLARGVEMDILLRTDPRYAAEGWLAQNARAGAALEFYQKPVYVPRFPGLQARQVPLDDRSIDGVATRRPEYIVLSSAGRRSITHYWNPDWRQGSLMLERPEARDLLRALEAEELPYRRVAEFSQTPWLIRQRITSLCPRITIYERLPGHEAPDAAVGTEPHPL